MKHDTPNNSVFNNLITTEYIQWLIVITNEINIILHLLSSKRIVISLHLYLTREKLSPLILSTPYFLVYVGYELQSLLKANVLLLTFVHLEEDYKTSNLTHLLTINSGVLKSMLIYPHILFYYLPHQESNQLILSVYIPIHIH